MENNEPQKSGIKIVFADGKTHECFVSAGHKIASYLMAKAKETGFLVLYDSEVGKSVCFSIGHIRSIEIQELRRKK